MAGLQTYDEVQSLMSGDVPAVVYKEARDEVAEVANLLADLQKQAPGTDDATRRKIVDRVTQYVNPLLDPNQFEINESKSDVKLAWSTTRFNNAFPFTLTAGQQIDASIAAQAAGGLRGDMEYAALLLNSTGRVAIRLQSPFLNRKISNIPLSSNLMFGNAQIPGLLAQSLLSIAPTTWSVTAKDLSNATNTVSMVTFGRRFADAEARRVDQVRRAMLFSQFMNPYFIGPLSGTVTVAGAGAIGSVAGGPEVTLLAGQSVTLRYDTGGSDYLLYWLLDDTTQSDGLEPNLTCQILMGDVAIPLQDLAISARDFVFAPTVAVAGMKQIGGIAGLSAAQCQSPGGGWTMLVRKGTKFQISFNNTNSIASAKTITLRNALGGIALYAPSDMANLLKTQVGAIQQGV